ncbi:MAG TPA: hypothetical protein VFS46_06280 [Nitrososphaera sp.]|nr:hypothetical protein [Nitrososphaera sp.]
MTEQAKRTYFCRICKATLFSYSDMAGHVGATGHEEYDVRADWPEK